MKTLFNKIKIGALITAAAAMPYVTSAQSISENYINPNEKTQTEKLGLTKREQNNQHQKPDIRYKCLGFNKYDYYASSDLDNDETPGTLKDAQRLEEGLQNNNLTQAEKYRADVNADGKVDQLDVEAIKSYANGQGKLIGIDYTSPEHTLEEKKEFVSNLFNKCYIPMFETIINSYGEQIIKQIGDWTCGDYTTQAVIAFSGMSDVDKYLNYDYISHPEVIEEFNTDINGLFNIQANMRWQKTKNDIMHIVMDVPLGNDLMKEENHLTIDSKTGVNAGIGSRFRAKTTTIDDTWVGIDDKGDVVGPCVETGRIRNYKVENDEFKKDFYVSKDYAFKRYEPPEGESTLEQKIHEFDKSKNYSLKELNAEPEFYDKITPTEDLKITQNITSNKEETGYYSNNFTNIYETTATDEDGLSTTVKDTVKVQDTTSPQITAYNETFEYSTNLSIPVAEDYQITDNGELLPTEIKDNSSQTMDGTINQVNYIINRTIKAEDISGNQSTKNIEYKVQDTTPPQGDWDNETEVDANTIEEGIELLKQNAKNIYDNSNLPVEIQAKQITEKEYDMYLRDVAQNETYLGPGKINLPTGINDSPFTEKEPLKAFNSGRNLQLEYWADSNEGVKIRLIDLSTGRVDKTLERFVNEGKNTITIPQTPNAATAAKLVQIIDEDKTNIQETKYLNR